MLRDCIGTASLRHGIDWFTKLGLCLGFLLHLLVKTQPDLFFPNFSYFINCTSLIDMLSLTGYDNLTSTSRSFITSLSRCMIVSWTIVPLEGEISNPIGWIGYDGCFSSKAGQVCSLLTLFKSSTCLKCHL